MTELALLWTSLKLSRYKRELAVTTAYAALLILVAFAAPSFFTAANARDLAMNNAPLLIIAVGMTLVILVGQIDISVGSEFAVCSVATGWLAKAGLPMAVVFLCVLGIGGLLGAINGILVTRLRLPSIVVTLAMLVAWRDGLRWVTQGAWVEDLPASFQWFGLGQTTGQWLIVTLAVAVLLSFGWILRNLGAGRAMYAVGSDPEAARLAGIDPGPVVFSVFVLMGALVGLAAVLNAARFAAVPANLGLGLELKAIAAVVVGGTVITGGRGTLGGTLVGAALLATIGTALTFAGINPFWEKAVQGAIILAALVSDTVLGQLNHVRSNPVPAGFDEN